MKPIAWLIAATALSAAPLHAAQPLPDELLEFLGSIDTAEDGWTDYLEQTDVQKVGARAGKATPAPPPSPPANPPAHPVPLPDPEKRP